MLVHGDEICEPGVHTIHSSVVWGKELSRVWRWPCLSHLCFRIAPTNVAKALATRRCDIA